MSEARQKLETIRAAMRERNLAAVRLKGVDWFAWATCGGSSVVILTSEAGVAEALVTERGAWIVTDAIEAPRMASEENQAGFEVWSRPWAEPERLREFVRDQAAGGRVASDRPEPGELPLPGVLVAAKRRLLAPEIERYRELGIEASRAMTETLRAARPEWTELDLIAEGARALWKRGIHPTLALACGDERLPLHRHPTPTQAKLGRRAMLVFCARRRGLYANLTRFAYFDRPAASELKLIEQVARIEAAALSGSRPGRALSRVYGDLAAAYAREGHPGEILKHHQGGATGYLSREVVATPSAPELIEDATALAWNPSLPGAKIEDTVLATRSGLEILTLDPEWPSVEIEGRRRPDILRRP